MLRSQEQEKLAIKEGDGVQKDLIKLIEAGLVSQPSREPEFFSYPSGYALAPSLTAYSLSQVDYATAALRERHAKLEPGS